MASSHSLSGEQRSLLESVVRAAREVAEAGAVAALARLAVAESEPPAYLSEEERVLRRRLRSHGRALGDLRMRSGVQETRHLVWEFAYEHWHRMLFARLLAAHGLLMWDANVAVTLEECHELAASETNFLGRGSGWALAGRLAAAMLPQVFSPDSAVLTVGLAPEHQLGLERILASLPEAVLRARDSLGWAYQYWQAKHKEEVNASQQKVGADELPAVTQLFTEDYMVNFLLAHTIERNAQEFAEIRFLDPCCGSGHFLVSALHFLVPLRQKAEGVSIREAVDAVLRENLFGLELDARCVEIAAFALALAAWTYPDETGSPLGYRPLPSLNLACSGRALAEARRIENSELRLRFEQAPLLGSLLISDFPKGGLQEGLAQSLLPVCSGESAEDDDGDSRVSAQGLLEAIRLLSLRYDYVLTNPPYLGRGRMCDGLRDFVETHYYDARHDLGAAFLELCLELTKSGGVIGAVIQQSWLFAGNYSAYRKRLLERYQLQLVANLGEGAFRSSDAAGAFPSLLVMKNAQAPDDATIRILDVSNSRTADEKMGALLSAVEESLPYADVRATPDYLIAKTSQGDLPLLSEFATPYVGLQTSDYPCYCRFFWELPSFGCDWELMQEAPEGSESLTGFSSIFYWQGGDGGQLMSSGLAYIRGQAAWGKAGVMVSRMRQLETSRYVGNFFNQTCAAIIPNDESLLPSLMAFCSSDEYTRAVREIDKRICVANSALARVPFDVEHWQLEGAKRYPDGLPKLQSNDPTQWVFHGHPWPSSDPLQVAVARLLGYRWPAEMDEDMDLSDEARQWIGRCADLAEHVAEDGIVCLPSVRGDKTADTRLLDLLIDAWERVEPGSWKASTLDKLLTEADCAGKGLDVWLRDKFFEQHAKRFQHRPFIWHVWDGLKDGFSALVNCHKLDARKLERLIHTYLGDWIRNQETGVRDGNDGAPIRLAAAQDLKRRLQLILEGERPYDVFVRWKKLSEQPIGWNPDLNDGVRLNIRPFMTADVLRYNKKPKLNITWDKDRGKDIESAPWFKVHKGERINDAHLTLAEKKAAQADV